MATDKDLQDQDVADAQSDEQAAVEEAVTPDKPAKRSPGEAAAEKAELKRQDDVRDAVAAANDNELPKLGGPLKEPGLGR